MHFIRKFRFVYILTNYTKTVLYVGVTNNIFRRYIEHHSGQGSIFTKRYNLKYLVFYKSYDDIVDAISVEKKLKNKNRRYKEKLINSINPGWSNLGEAWITAKEWYLEDLIN